MPVELLQTVGGKYRIEETIGEGGMGIVYRATNLETGHRVAIKALRAATSARWSLQERLIQEGRAQAQVRHPNIVAVTDVVKDDQGPMLVMEYVDGVGLDKLIATTRLSISELDDLARGMLAGLAAAHRERWIHRDLKPANILCERVDGVLVPRISDFGLAKVLDDPNQSSLTRSGMTMGSPSYMSPDQWGNVKLVDHRADLWSLGVVLYEVAAGKSPFPWDGSDQKELIDRIFAADYPDLAAVRPDLPERMVRAVRAALQPDRKARIGSCDELYELWFDRKSPLGRAAVAQEPSEGDAVERQTILPSPSAAPTSNVLFSKTAPLIRAQPPAEPEKRKSWLWVGIGGLVLLGLVAVASLLTGILMGPALALALFRAPPPPAPEPVVEPAPATQAPPEPAPQPAPPEPAPDVPPAAPAPSLVPAPEPGPVAAPEPAPPAATGALKLDARPFSEIFIDGRRAGQGLVDLEASEGPHRIEFVVLKGRLAGSRHTKEVVVRGSQAVQYCWDFDEEADCLDWP